MPYTLLCRCGRERFSWSQTSAKNSSDRYGRPHRVVEPRNPPQGRQGFRWALSEPGGHGRCCLHIRCCLHHQRSECKCALDYLPNYLTRVLNQMANTFRGEHLWLSCNADLNRVAISVSLQSIKSKVAVLEKDDVEKIVKLFDFCIASCVLTRKKSRANCDVCAQQ